MNKFFRSLIGSVIAAAIAFAVSGGNPVAAGVAFTSTFFVSYFYPTPEMDKMQPASLSDVSMPQVGEGSPIPIVYGRVKITPHIIWYGNLTFSEVKEEVDSGKDKEQVTTGYDYKLDLHLSLCQGKVNIVNFYIKDTSYVKSKYMSKFVGVNVDPNTQTQYTDNISGLYVDNLSDESPVKVNTKIRAVDSSGNVLSTGTGILVWDKVYKRFRMETYITYKYGSGTSKFTGYYFDLPSPGNVDYETGDVVIPVFSILVNSYDNIYLEVYYIDKIVYTYGETYGLYGSGRYDDVLNSKYVDFYDGFTPEGEEVYKVFTEANTGAPVLEAGFNGISNIYMKGFRLGVNTTYVPSMSFLVERDLSVEVPESLYPNMPTGNNPVAVIYDLLVNKCGINENNINMTNFAEKAYYFYEEQFGINFIIKSNESLVDIINKVCSYSNIYIYIDNNGLLCVDIAMPDSYTVVDSIVDDFISFNYSKSTAANCINSCSFSYVKDGLLSIYKVNNIGLIEEMDTITFANYDLTYLSNLDTVKKTVNRILKNNSYPFGFLSIEVSYKYAHLNINDVVYIENNDNGIVGDFKIVSIEESELERNVIRMELIQVSYNEIDEVNLDEMQLFGLSAIGLSEIPVEYIDIMYLDKEQFYSNKRELELYCLIPNINPNITGVNVYVSSDNMDFKLVKSITNFTDLYILMEDYYKKDGIDKITTLTLEKY